jgi:hypothetical protein
MEGQPRIARYSHGSPRGRLEVGDSDNLRQHFAMPNASGVSSGLGTYARCLKWHLGTRAVLRFMFN